VRVEVIDQLLLDNVHIIRMKSSMIAADFLRVLNHQLVGDKNVKKKNAVSELVSVGKQKHGIQLLSVLGLVHSTLSKVSFKLLEVRCYVKILNSSLFLLIGNLRFVYCITYGIGSIIFIDRIHRIMCE
jgi:hypothetical protein